MISGQISLTLGCGSFVIVELRSLSKENSQLCMFVRLRVNVCEGLLLAKFLTDLQRYTYGGLR